MDIETFAPKVKTALAENAKAIAELKEAIKKIEETLARLTQKDEDDDDW